jgi:N-acyl-phosphatidylethanolamine-hydrolysing phospholipase D
MIAPPDRCAKASVRPAIEFPWKARRRGKRFVNLCTDYVPKLRDVIRWKLGLGRREKTSSHTEEGRPLETVAPDFIGMHRRLPDDIAATWFGHSTFLLQTGGCSFLTDPIFSSHCAPIPLKRFERKSPARLLLRDLPRIDAVLISHNHYDHLDRETLLALGTDVAIVCPVGVARLLKRWGFANVRELSWGESTGIGGVQIASFPTQHGSARSLFDRNQSLWCGWIVRHGGRATAFLGDTGYAPYFRELGDYFGPIDLALIPIGAYRPSWFMKPLHLDPAEAVRVHQDLRAGTSIAMHWGTFSLSDEPLDEPPRLLRETLGAMHIADEAFRIPRLNETIAI